MTMVSVPPTRMHIQAYYLTPWAILIAAGIGQQVMAEDAATIVPSALPPSALPANLSVEEPIPQSSLITALNNGELDLSFRYRYENIDQQGIPNQAHASTLRSRFRYTSGAYHRFKLGLEVDNVSLLGGDNHNDFTNGVTGHPVVADPQGTDLNQAWVSYTGFKDTSAKYGRQRINLDNQRFIGGVAWRQNEQTYDGLTLINNTVEDLTVVYAYINNVNLIFGPDDGGKPADLDAKSHMLNGSYKGLPIGALSAYSYWLDFKDSPAASTRTAGLRLTGSHRLNGLTYNYSADYAQQSDYAENGTDFDADYVSVQAGVASSTVNGKIGFESLEGNSTFAGQFFRTPLATLHRFNGWADQFLNTPAAGLEDRYIQAGGKIHGIGLTAVYHQFDAQDGSADYGSEFDLSAVKKVCDHTQVLLKYANYNASDFGSDIQKIWLQVQFEL